jgi:hypothetical protein
MVVAWTNGVGVACMSDVSHTPARRANFDVLDQSLPVGNPIGQVRYLGVLTWSGRRRALLPEVENLPVRADLLGLHNRRLLLGLRWASIKARSLKG